MELSLTTIFFLVVAFAVGAAILLFMIGQWLDLTGIRYKMESHRNALNLLQLMVSNSPLVERDMYGRPNKLILEETALDAYENPGYDMYDINNLDDELHKCCQFLDFDYTITVGDNVTGRRWNIADLPFKEDSECYPDRFIGYADMPVVIHNTSGFYNPGFIEITLVKTTLSDLSFWLSHSFIRTDPDWPESMAYFVGEYEKKVEVMVPIDPEIIQVVVNKTGVNPETVCMEFSSGRIACKRFVTSDATLDSDPTTLNIVGKCYEAWIVTDIEFQEVAVS